MQNQGYTSDPTNSPREGRRAAQHRSMNQLTEVTNPDPILNPNPDSPQSPLTLIDLQSDLPPSRSMAFTPMVTKAATPLEAQNDVRSNSGPNPNLNLKPNPKSNLALYA